MGKVETATIIILLLMGALALFSEGYASAPAKPTGETTCANVNCW